MQKSYAAQARAHQLRLRLFRFIHKFQRIPLRERQWLQAEQKQNKLSQARVEAPEKQVKTYPDVQGK